ncbi:class I SAM-dependent methyltransferase [Dongia sedimenti]|uniref:SAM-dependent methyltransferase n=1 Tax=Dongia sedimenti TaxID=3064282 RepID=A0ABU0YMZ4_9PROT|nr:SAM-dependent methyltransferase [Rhodospirillaceae bacterium R-7]
MQVTPPSSWIARHANLIPKPGPVLDLAAGNGRHTRYIKGLGYAVVAVDRDISGLADLAGDAQVEVITADLEGGAPWPLGTRRFAGIVVTNYLHRPLFPEIAAALQPGGVLIYETFGLGNERFGRPSNPDFLLQPGELLGFAQADGLVVRAYHCGEVAEPRPAVLQRMAAQRP